MKTYDIDIRFERSLYLAPDITKLSRGDVVRFQNNSDMLMALHFDFTALFGGTDYAIEPGDTLLLVVQRYAPKATYVYSVRFEGLKPRPGSPCIIVNGTE